MDLEQLTGRYRRLKDELAGAYGQRPWPTGRIDRLAEDIARTELALAATGTDPIVGKATARTPHVERNRLTPFGPRLPEPAAK